MITQTIQVAIGAGAAPFNITPSSFNPVPVDGVMTVDACLDPLGSPSSADTPPSISVQLGGATPIQPVQPTALTTNVFGQIGAPPSPANRVMPEQGVTRGTNTQITLIGGSQNYTAYIKVVLRSLQEVSQGIGEAA